MHQIALTRGQELARQLGLPPGRTALLGVVNTTPDSFSDGGQFLDSSAAIDHARNLLGAGADIVDVGGYSTRPGAAPVPPTEEAARILPVVRALAADGVVVSVDTFRSDVARAAIKAGARIINDVSGTHADPAMAEVVADAGVVYICQHWRGTPETMDSLATYTDLLGQVRDELASRLTALERAGVAADKVVVDPGLGFAKDADQSWQVAAHWEFFAELGHPVLLGASRKRMLAAVLGEGGQRPARDRDVATAAFTALAAASGVWGVRVHDVAASADARAVGARWRQACQTSDTQESNAH